MADCKNLLLMIDKLSRCTNAQNPVVVMDAGIATEENLEMISAKECHYLCVSRTKLKDKQPLAGNSKNRQHKKNNHHTLGQTRLG